MIEQATVPVRSPAAGGGRAPLTRERVLREALEYVDGHGLEALSMHKLGAQLGVKAMSLYNHVDGKPDLLDGLVHVLWEEAERDVEVGPDWRGALRSLAHTLRAVVRRHPDAAPLLMTRPTMPEPALRLCDAQLQVLGQAGFDDEHAVEVVRTIIGYALGHVLCEMCWTASAGLASEGTCEAPGAGGESELQRLRWISRLVPPDVPDRLLEVAVKICGECDTERPFELGLDLMIRGLHGTAEPH